MLGWIFPCTCKKPGYAFIFLLHFTKTLCIILCSFPYSLDIKNIHPGVAQLVARLLWEQDAASSSLATWTKSPKSAFVDFGLFVCGTNITQRHPANKAGFLLWAKTLCAACGRYSRAFCVQRSKKSRISASPKIFSGTANRRRSRGCREFESRHLDQISRSGYILFLLISLYNQICFTNIEAYILTVYNAKYTDWFIFSHFLVLYDTI